MVPEFPERDHPELATDCQVAFPEASVVRTYPDVTHVVRRNPKNEPVQATSSLYDGADTQIPILPAPVHISPEP